VELLLSMQAKMQTNRKAYHEEMMAMLDAYHERDDGLSWKDRGRYRED
jgi:hypothetical protein